MTATKTPAQLAKGTRRVSRVSVTAVQATAWKSMEALLGKSYKVLDRALNDHQIVAVLNHDGTVAMDARGRPRTMTIGGDTDVAKFVVTQLMGKGASVLMKDIKADISNMDGVMAAAQEVMTLLLSRQMAINDAQKVLSMLITYASLRAYSGVQELKAILEDLNMKTVNGASTVNPYRPTWGNLSADTPTANKTAAE